TCLEGDGGERSIGLQDVDNVADDIITIITQTEGQTGARSTTQTFFGAVATVLRAIADKTALDRRSIVPTADLIAAGVTLDAAREAESVFADLERQVPYALATIAPAAERTVAAWAERDKGVRSAAKVAAERQRIARQHRLAKMIVQALFD